MTAHVLAEGFKLKKATLKCTTRISQDIPCLLRAVLTYIISLLWHPMATEKHIQYVRRIPKQFYQQFLCFGLVQSSVDNRFIIVIHIFWTHKKNLQHASHMLCYVKRYGKVTLSRALLWCAADRCINILLGYITDTESNIRPPQCQRSNPEDNWYMNYMDPQNVAKQKQKQKQKITKQNTIVQPHRKYFWCDIFSTPSHNESAHNLLTVATESDPFQPMYGIIHNSV